MKILKGIKKTIFYLAEILSRKIWITFSVFSIAFILTGGVIYYFLDKRVEASLVEQILHRQQVSVRSGWISTRSFFNNVQKSMIFLSKNKDIFAVNKQSQIVLEDYIDEWKNTPLVTVILVNSDGKIIYSADNKDMFLNQPVGVSDRDYFISAVNSNKSEVFMGDPIIARDVGGYKDALILPLSIPLFENGEVNGVLGVGILIQDLVKEYIEPLKISENSQIYFLSSNGTFISSFYPELVGKNIEEVFKSLDHENKELILDLIRNILATKEEGKVDIKFPKDFQETSGQKRILFSYSPVEYGTKTGVLIAGTPFDHIYNFIGPIFSFYSLSLIIFVLYIVLFTFFSLTIIKFVQKVSFLKGCPEVKEKNKYL